MRKRVRHFENKFIANAMTFYLADGYRVIYDRECPFEVRVQDTTEGPQQIGSLEAIKVKCLLLGEDDNPQSVRIELSSEADLFYQYTHELDESGFAVRIDCAYTDIKYSLFLFLFYSPMYRK